MVHADVSNFSSSLTKSDGYASILSSMTSLAEGQRNWVCNLANAASLLWHMYHSLPAPSSSVNWAGFYVIDPMVSEQLILGPFQGKVACQIIRFGRGVCGKAAKMGETVLVPDVEKFEEHIACDNESRSEIVVPIWADRKVVGVIDIDCADENGFDEEDRTGLEEFAKLLGESCDWSLKNLRA